MTQIDPSKLVFNIDGKKYTIVIPKDSDIKIRKEQNPNCNRSNHICGLYRSQLVCLECKPTVDKDGSLDLGSVRLCKHEPNKRGLIL